MKRILDINERVSHSVYSISENFMNTYNYKIKNDMIPFVIRDNDGEEKLYSSIYHNFDFQILMTKACPFNCKFCIEKINPQGCNERVNIERQLTTLRDNIRLAKKAGLRPTVSITGGEPMLYPENLKKVRDLCFDEDLHYFNLNTSGYDAERYPDLLMSFPHINLSVHSPDVVENSNVFQTTRNDYWNLDCLRHATIQTVIQNNSLEYLENFLNSFTQDKFSIRFPNDCMDYEIPQDWQEIMDSVVASDRFKFLHQKIGDYFVYELFEYTALDGTKKSVRFRFGSNNQLRYYKETLREKRILRSLIVSPEGNLIKDWVEDVED